MTLLSWMSITASASSVGEPYCPDRTIRELVLEESVGDWPSTMDVVARIIPEDEVMGTLQVVGAFTATHAPRIDDGPPQNAVATFLFEPRHARLARDEVRRPWCPLRRFVEVCGLFSFSLMADDGRSIDEGIQMCFRGAADGHPKTDIPVFMVPDPSYDYPPRTRVMVYPDAAPDDDDLRVAYVFGRTWGPMLELHARSPWLAYRWTSDAAVVPTVP
ncbi:MAG: hypothetical protein H6735_14320 [Alphaproteobacteria bacterium]|nr:hypothetical protein [Alphaproteobacteria bacterium]